MYIYIGGAHMKGGWLCVLCLLLAHSLLHGGAWLLALGEKMPHPLDDESCQVNLAFLAQIIHFLVFLFAYDLIPMEDKSRHEKYAMRTTVATVLSLGIVLVASFALYGMANAIFLWYQVIIAGQLTFYLIEVKMLIKQEKSAVTVPVEAEKKSPAPAGLRSPARARELREIS